MEKTTYTIDTVELANHGIFVEFLDKRFDDDDDEAYMPGLDFLGMLSVFTMIIGMVIMAG